VAEDLRELYARIAKRHNGTAMAEAATGSARLWLRVLPHILQELRFGNPMKRFSAAKAAA